MPPKKLRSATLALALGATTMVAALGADTIWTIHDLDTVADAATASATGMKGKDTQASMLLSLAEALSKAGATARARVVLVKAGSMLDPPDDMSSTARQKIISDLVKLGDVTAAEALTNVDAPLPVKAKLLGALGTARAQTGDINGAHQIAGKIAGLGPASDAFGDRSGEALKNIGVALVEVGALDEALHIAGGMANKAAALQIIARAATTLCNASKSDKGSDLAERAAGNARAIAAAVDKPYLIIEPILSAAEPMIACSGLASAAAFVRSAIPPQTQDATRTALIDRLANTRQLDLALAVASPPKPDDAKGFFDYATRLKRKGDLSAATTAALEASRIIINGKDSPKGRVALGNVIDLLADLGAYDSAIAATQAVPLISYVYANQIPMNRYAYYVRIVGAAIEHKDRTNVRRLSSIAITALNAPAPNGTIRTPQLEDLVVRLARGGYRNEARPIFDQLSGLSQDTTVAPANRIPPERLAVVKAAMGDLPGALKSADDAGPIVTTPSALQILALATMHFDNPSVRPTPDQFKAAMEEAKAAMPGQVAGPKARALSAVVRELTAQDDIAGALQVVAELDVEPRDTLAPQRDWALSMIAEAQMRTGDLRGALATTLQITQGDARWRNLLRLAANQPGP
jgi:hypothetical protein